MARGRNDRGSSDGRRLLRARSIVARTFYRELRAAGYERADVLEVVNNIMGLVSEALRAPPAAGDVGALVDGESGLLMGDVFAEVVDFELDLIRRGRRRAVSLVLVDAQLPDHAAHPIRRKLQEHVAAVFSGALRANDAAARFSATRYAVLLSDASESTARRVIQRLRSELEPNAPHGARFAWRLFADNSGTHGFQRLIEQCELAAPLAFPPLGRARDADRPSQPGAPIALAMGGGAARAAAHVGALRAMQAMGTNIAAIAGTSAGALVGAMFALGMPTEEILERFTGFRYSDTYRALRAAYRRFSVRAARSSDPYFRRSSLVFVSAEQLFAASDELLAQFVEYFVGRDRPIPSLPIPFACSATDLSAGRTVTLAHGSLHDALKATCAVPGLFPPVRIGAMTLIDGSALLEVPVPVARELAPDAALVSLYLMRPDEAPEGYNNSAEVATRVHALAHRELVREQLRDSGFVVSLPVQDVGWLGFERSRELAETGERLMRECADELQAFIMGAGIPPARRAP